MPEKTLENLILGYRNGYLSSSCGTF